MPHAVHHRTRITGALCGAIALLALTGCSSTTGALAAVTQVPASARVAAAPVHAAAPASAPQIDRTTPAPRAWPTSTHASTTNGGSLTVSLTEPAAVSGSGAATVTCTAGRTYRAAAGPASIDGTTISFAVTAVAYRGPGEYTAAVTGSVAKSDDSSVPLALPSGVPATITTSGGSVRLTGSSIAGALAWTCGA